MEKPQKVFFKKKKKKKKKRKKEKKGMTSSHQKPIQLIRPAPPPARPWDNATETAEKSYADIPHARNPLDFYFIGNLNGVVRTLKKLRTSKGDYWIKQWFSSIASLFKWKVLLKKRICSQREQILSFIRSSL